MAEKTPAKNDKPSSNLNHVDQAAVLLMSLGEADAAEVLRHMGPKEVQRIGSAMSQLKSVQQSDVRAVLSGFLDEVRNLTGLGADSDSYIRNMLVTALGEDKAGDRAHPARGQHLGPGYPQVDGAALGSRCDPQ